MNFLHFFWSIPALLAASASASQRVPVGVVSSVTYQQTTIFRIPVRPHPAEPMFGWQEKKGPKCLPANDIAGAMLSGHDSIDFVMRDRERFRARIDDDCAALDFYKGFYVQPPDERLCAKRDEIRSRMGASCRIEKFRALIPQFRR